MLNNRAYKETSVSFTVRAAIRRKFFSKWMLGIRQMKCGIVPIKKPKFCYAGFRHLRNKKEHDE